MADRQPPHGPNQPDGRFSTMAETAEPPRNSLSAAPTEPAEEHTAAELAQFPLELETVPRANYEALGEIARGGLGRIYRAMDQRLGRVVAIKELLHPTPSANLRFLREIQLTVSLEHPNIVAIHEAGRWPTGELYYAMNFVDGRTLLEVIEGTTSLESRLSLLANLIRVAEAVAFAHMRGLIHRDLKPANILVGPFGETVVIDWGLARHVQAADPALPADEPTVISIPGSTRPGAIVGTPPYMPPEQAQGETVDERADVYALGALLYHVLAGHAPYQDQGTEHVLEKLLSGPPTPLGSLVPDLAPDLLAIVGKAMQRDPAQRYASGASMAEELRRFRDGRMVGAYSYTTGERVLRFVRRHLAAVATAAVAAVLVATLAIISVSRIRQERDAAQQERDNVKEQTRALVIAQALALTATDPSKSVATLQTLDRARPGALSAAARARESGVSRWVLSTATSALQCSSLSSTGNLLAVGAEDGTVVVWRLSPEPPRLEMSRLAHSDHVTACSFSPNGRWLATGSRDGTLALWETRDFTPRPLNVPGGSIKRLAFSETSTELVAATDAADGSDTLRRWSLPDLSFRDAAVDNVRSPQVAFLAGRWLTGPHQRRLRVWGNEPTDFSESPPSLDAIWGQWLNGQLVVVGLSGGGLEEWNPDTGDHRQLDTVETLASERATTMQSVTAGSHAGAILVGTSAGAVHLVTGDSAPKLVTRHKDRVTTVAVSASGRLVASAGWDKVVRLHDLEHGNDRTLLGHRDVILKAEFTADEGRLVTTSRDRTARLWDVTDPQHAQRRVLSGHRVGVHSARFSHDGRRLVSGGHDDTVRLWDLETGKSRVLLGHGDHVFRTLFTHDDRYVVSSSDDQTVRVWSTTSDEHFVLAGHQADVEELHVSPDDRLLASAAEDHTARVWDLKTRASQILQHGHDVTQVRFSPDGHFLATAARDGEVRLYDARAGLPLPMLQVFQDHLGEVWALDFSSTDQLMVSADLVGRVLVRDLISGNTNGAASAPGAQLLRLAPDGQRMAIAGIGGELWLCPLDGAPCSLLKETSNVVHALTFAPDGATLFVAGSEGSVTAWDLATGETQVWGGHRASIYDLDVSPDGQTLASASADATIRLWPVIPLPETAHFATYLDQLSAEVHANTIPPP